MLATVVRLLDSTFLRIGNKEYARTNGSFGLTTLRDRHVEIHSSEMRFHFPAKSGQKSDVVMNDAQLARIVKKCQEIPGYELFQYIDDDGKRCVIRSEDVNQYLRGIRGEDFTAKDFRTWAGTVLAAQALQESGPCGGPETQLKKRIVGAVKSAAQRLGNRPATCRNYYIHPVVIEAYRDGSLFRNGVSKIKALRPEECCVMNLLAHASDSIVPEALAAMPQKLAA